MATVLLYRDEYETPGFQRSRSTSMRGSNPAVFVEPRQSGSAGTRFGGPLGNEDAERYPYTRRLRGQRGYLLGRPTDHCRRGYVK